MEFYGWLITEVCLEVKKSHSSWLATIAARAGQETCWGAAGAPGTGMDRGRATAWHKDTDPSQHCPFLLATPVRRGLTAHHPESKGQIWFDLWAVWSLQMPKEGRKSSSKPIGIHSCVTCCWCPCPTSPEVPYNPNNSISPSLICHQKLHLSMIL